MGHCFSKVKEGVQWPSSRKQNSSTGPSDSSSPSKSSKTNNTHRDLDKPPAVEPTKQRLPQPQAYGAEGYELVNLHAQEVGQLGSGRSSVLKLMQNKKTKEMVAVKFVEREAGSGSLSKNTEREIVNHRRLLHPNIIRFYEVFVTEDHLAIVMEYASGGTLYQRLIEQGHFTEDAARRLYTQLLAGMKYCHDRGIYHRDLRLENIHLHGPHFEPQLKITGFGYSKSALLDSPAKTNVGSPMYTPPELLKSTRNEGASYDGGVNDIWSSGVILFYMLTARLPFEDPTSPGALSRKMMQNIVNIQYSFPAEVPLSPECRDFVGRIFVADPHQRIKIAGMYSHPWLTGSKLPPQATTLVEPSQQTESEIHDIVEKARKRRESRRSDIAQAIPSQHRNLSDFPKQSSSTKQLLNGTDGGLDGPSFLEVGIAEVPRR